MLNKYQVLNTIGKEKIMAVVRLDEEEKAINIVRALILGGIKVIEFPFTCYTHTILERITKEFKGQATFGAGTVLDTETARLAILSGAQFLVTPTLNVDVVKLCNRYSVPCLTGVYTPTEALLAVENGVDVVKLFPATEFKPSFIKDLKGPFPNMEIMPMGGITLRNAKEWIDGGAFAVGVGKELTKDIKGNDFKSVTETAQKFINLIK